jgi:hypothetical protein
MVENMRRPTAEDLQLLREIRGRFSDTKSNQIRDYFAYFLVGVLFPVFFLAIYFFLNDPHLWLLVLMSLGSFILAAILWRDRNLEYEFTGDEIIERRAGRVRNQIQISRIVNADVKILEHILTLETENSKMTIRILAPLNEVIQRNWAKLLATKSDAERQDVEKVNREMISRLKRANLIAVLALIALMLAIGLLVAWLEKKL